MEVPKPATKLKAKPSTLVEASDESDSISLSEDSADEESSSTEDQKASPINLKNQIESASSSDNDISTPRRRRSSDNFMNNLMKFKKDIENEQLKSKSSPSHKKISSNIKMMEFINMDSTKKIIKLDAKKRRKSHIISDIALLEKVDKSIEECIKGQSKVGYHKDYQQKSKSS